jgi:serine/threonine-protein kinase RsbW
VNLDASQAAPGDRSFTLANRNESLAAAREQVIQHLQSKAVDDKAVYAVDFALEELVGNTLRYGYDTLEERAIVVEVSVASTTVRIAITDDAREFDPTLHSESALPRTLGDAPIGGRGIAMVRRLVRAMRYRRASGLNRLEIDVQRNER